MKEADKARVLNAPVSQTCLFGDAVENFAQQFSSAQKQTEAIRHILPPLPRSRRSNLQLSSTVEPAAGQPPRPSRPPPNQAASVGASGPETDDPGMEMNALREMVNAPLPPRRRAGRRILCFFFFRHWPHGQWYPKA